MMKGYPEIIFTISDVSFDDNGFDGIIHVIPKDATIKGIGP